jgi:hypothetical protein
LINPITPAHCDVTIIDVLTLILLRYTILTFLTELITDEALFILLEIATEIFTSVILTTDSATRPKRPPINDCAVVIVRFS